jgi:hypothetical protein
MNTATDVQLKKPTPASATAGYTAGQQVRILAPEEWCGQIAIVIEAFENNVVVKMPHGSENGTWFEKHQIEAV